MALNTTIAIGLFTQNTMIYSTLLSCLEVVVSLLWIFVNLGGKYWQSRWKKRAAIYEKEVSPDANFLLLQNK